LVPEQKLLRLFIGLAHKVDSRLPTKCWCQSKNCCAIYWSGTQGGQPTSDKMLVPEQKLLRNLLVWHTRYQNILAATLIAKARMAVLKANETMACSSTRRRMAGEATAMSAVCEATAMVKAKYRKSL
jgi:hypothetical protein